MPSPLQHSTSYIAYVIVLITSISFLTSCTPNNKQATDSVCAITTIDTFLYTKEKITDVHIRQFTNTYPAFASDFFHYILGIDSTKLDKAISIQQLNYYKNLFSAVSDSVKRRITSLQDEATLIQKFLHSYKKLFRDTTLKIPAIFAYTAPIDAPAIALFSQSIGINLTLFAGKDFPLYNVPNFQAIFPRYLHHRLEKVYIPFLILQQLLMDRFPSKHSTSLIERMIVLGRYWYIMNQITEKNNQYICMYTAQQLNWCQRNEVGIWHWVREVVKDIYTKDVTIIRDYIGESPHTQGMSKESPGNIGPWIGMQIVEKFMEENSSVTLNELMQINPYQLFQQSMYNPQ